MFNVKVVIIGGGIAGLTAAIALKKIGHKVIVREKLSIDAKQGMAFMIHSDTLKNIQTLTNAPLTLEKHKVNNFLLLTNSGNEEKNVPLIGWYAMKRITLLKFLRSQLCDNEFSENSDFSRLEYEGDKAIAAIFKDGSIEYGDLFIGADGINSLTRKYVCEADFFANQINEFVCIVKNEENNLIDNSFRKFKSVKKEMAFGFIPLSSNEHVWFFQFNKNLYAHLFEENRDNMNALSSKLLAELPEHIGKLIKKSDLKKGHLWISKELKILSSYYKANVCLIGDAAHGSIPLTSSGVSNGVTSAVELAEFLSHSEPLGAALDKYEKTRKKKNTEIIEYAKKLKNQFSTSPSSLDDYYLPLFK